MSQLNLEKEAAIEDVSNLEKQLNEQINFLMVIQENLKGKKLELEASHTAALHQLKKESQEEQEAHRLKMAKHVQEKRDIFVNYLS